MVTRPDGSVVSGADRHRVNAILPEASGRPGTTERAGMARSPMGYGDDTARPPGRPDASIMRQ